MEKPQYYFRQYSLIPLLPYYDNTSYKQIKTYFRTEFEFIIVSEVFTVLLLIGSFYRLEKNHLSLEWDPKNPCLLSLKSLLCSHPSRYACNSYRFVAQTMCC